MTTLAYIIQEPNMSQTFNTYSALFYIFYLMKYGQLICHNHAIPNLSYNLLRTYHAIPLFYSLLHTNLEVLNF